MTAELCLVRVDQNYAVPIPFVKCTICGKEVNWREIVNHYVSHGGRECPICSVKVRGAEYRSHVRRHFIKRQRVYMCGICGKQSTAMKSILVHIMKNHEK